MAVISLRNNIAMQQLEAGMIFFNRKSVDASDNLGQTRDYVRTHLEKNCTCRSFEKTSTKTKLNKRSFSRSAAKLNSVDLVNFVKIFLKRFTSLETK